MNINIDSLTGREKRPLKRADVEEKLQQAGSSEKLNLVGETLVNSNLSGLNLTGAALNGANFTGAYLTGANLTGANLTWADLTGTNLTKANLTKANLTGADLTGADLTDANLTGAHLNRAHLNGAHLNRANLTDTHLTEAALNGANFTGADLTGANLSDANLSGVDLTGADLTGANFTRAYLSRANLFLAKLSGTNLSGTDLSGTDLSGANLSGTDLSGNNLSGADLTGTNLTDANLSGANLSGANLSRTILSRTNLTGTKFIKSDLIINANIAQAMLDQITGSQKEKQKQATNTVPILHIRIEEQPLTAYYLSEVLSSLTSLYVKMWLLQQNRFDDFLLYSEHKEPRFEEEARLIIAELTYNSPANIKFNLDFSPKSFVEALQMLIDTIVFRKHRERIAAAESHSKNLDNQLKEEAVKKEQLKTLEQYTKTAKYMVETLHPNLNEEQKVLAISSILKDILKLTQSPILEISLSLPPTFVEPQPESTQVMEVKQSSTQPVGTDASMPKATKQK